MIQIATEFVLNIVMWFIVGYIISFYLNNNIFIIIFFFIGLIMGFLRFVKLIKEYNRINKK